MTPAMQAYVDQFKQSQAAQQQTINAGLLQAMHGLGERRDAAAQLVASLPGQYGNIQNEANQDLAASAQTAALPKGVPTTADAQAVMNTTNQGIANGNAQIGIAAKQGVPLLNMATAADYSKGATTLQNTHMMNQAQIQAQQQGFDSDMLKAQAQFQHDQAAQQQAHSDALALERMREGHDTNERTSTEAWQASQNKASADAAPALDPVLAQQGITQGDATRAKQSPAYVEYSKALGADSTKDAEGRAAMIRAHLQATNPALLAVLVEEFPTQFANAKMPAAGNPGGLGAALDVHGWGSRQLLGWNPLTAPAYWGYRGAQNLAG